MSTRANPNIDSPESSSFLVDSSLEPAVAEADSSPPTDCFLDVEDAEDAAAVESEEEEGRNSEREEDGKEEEASVVASVVAVVSRLVVASVALALLL